MLYVFVRFNAAVPTTSLEKSKTNVSHCPETVVIASVSTEIAPLVLSSAFKRIGIPASGDHTSTDIIVADAVKGIALAKPLGVLTVVPAHNCAVASLTTSDTKFGGLTGSVITVAVFPPKSVIV